MAPDQSGAELISALAEVSSAMKIFAAGLRSHSSWREVSANVSVNRYEDDGVVIECYVDGERSDGRGFCWWLEAQWHGDQWSVEAVLMASDREGQNAVQQSGPIHVASSSALATELRLGVKELLRFTPPGPE
jgi:hypothetical protein